MSLRSVDEVSAVLEQLYLMCQLREGDKIDVLDGNLIAPGWLSSTRRMLSGQSRIHTVNYLRDLARRVVALLQYTQLSPSDYNMLTHAVKEAQGGLLSLTKTYSSDATIVAQLKLIDRTLTNALVREER